MDEGVARGLWRELRSLPLAVQFGAGAFALSMIGAAIAVPILYSGHSNVAESEWPAGHIPDAAENPVLADADPSEEPEPPGPIPPYGGEPLWNLEIEDEQTQVVHIDQGTLLLTDGELRLEADGETVWTHTWEEFRPEIGIADEVAVISGDLPDDDSWPGRRDTVALDLDDGEEVWRDQDASFVSVFSDAVLMTECTGEQDDHIGDCTLHARDPGDLSTRWSTPTYASARVIDSSPWTGRSLPDPLLIESFPTGHESRTVTVLDGGTATTRVETSHDAFATDTMLVTYTDYDDNPADGCTANLIGHSLESGEPAWEVEAAMAKSANLALCGELSSVAPKQGMLPLTVDRAPVAFDLDAGEAAWTAPEEGRALALSGDAGVFVAADWEAEEDNLVAYDTDSGEELWRSTADIGASAQASVIGSTLWLYGSGSMWGWSDYTVYAYSLDTGEGAALPGSVGYFPPGEVVTVSDDWENPELEAWPVELW